VDIRSRELPLGVAIKDILHFGQDGKDGSKKRRGTDVIDHIAFRLPPEFHSH
jgi:hypothetical protein